MRSAKKNRFNPSVLRIVLTSAIFIAITLVIVYLVKISGLEDKISTVDKLREFIASKGAFAVFFLIVFQVLQVVVLPVPGVVAVGAAVALFGPLKGAVYSLIGILIGSFIAYYIGRILGFKAVNFLLGEKVVNDLLLKTEGRGAAFLTVAFIFPFFPDDALCFVAGLIKMEQKFFAFIIILTRIVSTFLTAYSINGDLIPYDTPQGVSVWILIFFVTIVSFNHIYGRINESKKTDRKKKFLK